MRYGHFLTYNVVGGLLWAVGVTLLGYFLGNAIPDVDRYLLPIIVFIVLISVAPAAYHMLKDAETRNSLLALARKPLVRLGILR